MLAEHIVAFPYDWYGWGSGPGELESRSVKRGQPAALAASAFRKWQYIYTYKGPQNILIYIHPVLAGDFASTIHKSVCNIMYTGRYAEILVAALPRPFTWYDFLAITGEITIINDWN